MYFLTTLKPGIKINFEILSKNIIREIALLKKQIVDKELPELAYRSRILSNLYYILFNKSFAREHQATLSGKVKHIRETEKLKENYFMLIRNTHRIEKALLMRPRRDVFAKEYIKETIDSFEGVWNNHEDRSNPQLKWFHDY